MAVQHIRFCRCLQLLRYSYPTVAVSSFFSLTNEVLNYSQRNSSLGIAYCGHRKRRLFHPQNSYGARQYTKQFSPVTSDSKSALYSLISIKVKGSDEAVLKSYTEFITIAAGHLKIDISGRIILPTSIQRHTVLKSPHIYKKHRAQYEVRTHAQMLQVKNVTGDTADTFLEYIQRNIPEGVSMSVEQTALEPFPEFFELPAEAKAFLDEQKTQSEKNDISAIEQ
ncbi:small ribosomal subunit protein uS10m-like isoform X1 [Montipora capricornis]|uniref:small ribosomal subunit protein uS10m-like isoform X1 n=1 Tax=Montipora capricornis TaxID=246305 RepID=UPI0035F1F1F0